MIAIACLLAISLGTSVEDMAKALSDVIGSDAHRYAAKDDRGAGLDCLKVEQVENGRYLGVHHTLSNGVFELHLVESTDLMNWRYVSTIDTHAHQGTIRKFDNVWLLAWEKDGPDGNWIHVAGYSSLNDLRENKPERQIDLPRSLSPAAEGTPSFSFAFGLQNWDTSHIDIAFHYYRNRDVDRQAVGSLVGFKTWKAKVRPEWNEQLQGKYKGNIGDRDQFFINYVPITLLEAQLKKDDWSSWRILLHGPDNKWSQLDIRTHGGSTSFANPSVTMLTLPNGKPGVFAAYFLPNQGAAKDESGELIFYRTLVK